MWKAAELAETLKTRTGIKVCLGGLMVLMGVSVVSVLSGGGDVLNGFSSRQKLAKWQLELTIGGFCMSSLPEKLMRDSNTARNAPLGKFKETGDIMEDSYSKSSIYALLYAFYASIGTVKSDKGVPYEFTFNTWGVAPTPGFPDDDPQRFGKAAYAGLAQTPAVSAYITARHGTGHLPSPLGKGLKIVEVGSGTGAGAHLIAGDLLPGAHYTALDMQAQGTATCQRRHGAGVVDGTSGKANVTCVHVPKGVGPGSPIIDGRGKRVASGSVDIVIICETHIAATQIGPEEEAIFAEIHRVLAPGGLFIWGNALPTYVWNAAPAFVTGRGFSLVLNENVTKGAIIARDLDAPRVNAFWDAWSDSMLVSKIFGTTSLCGRTLEMLVKNFYRHPGTALYNTMVTGHDSYCRHVYKKKGPGHHVAKGAGGKGKGKGSGRRG